MALYVPAEGEVRLLQNMIQAMSKSDNYWLRLFNNNYTPVAGTTHTALPFVETTFTGYSVATLGRSSWSNAYTVAGGNAETSYATQSWTCGTQGDTVYGYWVEDALDRTIDRKSVV